MTVKIIIRVSEPFYMGYIVDCMFIGEEDALVCRIMWVTLGVD